MPAPPLAATPVRTDGPTARWHALGTYAHLALEDAGALDAAVAVAQAVLAGVDRACSRFRDDSDLVRANRHHGSWVDVDPLLAAATSVAVEAARATDGLVDPLLGRTLVRLGYDADLDVVRRREASYAVVPLPPADRHGAWTELLVDPAGAVRVPAGTALDLGATAKAWAADLVAASVVDRLGGRVLVSLGGDLRVDGPGVAKPWPVLVAERPDEEVGALVGLDSGGLATSSTLARRWRTGAGERHHVVDPRTGVPAVEVWRTVSATGPTCVAANVATTAALVLGRDAVPWLAARGVSARLVAADGTLIRVGDWPPDVPSPLPRRT